MYLTRDNMKALTYMHRYFAFSVSVTYTRHHTEWSTLCISPPGETDHQVSGTSLMLPILDICFWEEKIAYVKPEIRMAVLSVCSTSCQFLCLFLRVEKPWYFPGIVTALRLRISKHFRKIKINPHSMCIFCVSFITDSLQYCHIARTENRLGGGKLKHSPVIQYPNLVIRNLWLIYKQFLWTGLEVPGPSWKGSVLVSSYYTVEWLVEMAKNIIYAVKMYGSTGAEPLDCSYCQVDKKILVTRLMGPTPLSV